MSFVRPDRLHGPKPFNIDFGFKATDKVLDIGAGHRPHPKCTHVVDFNSSDIDPMQRHGHDLKMEKHIEYNLKGAPEGLKGFGDDFFDFVYSSHCIEHIIDLEEAIEEIGRIGRRGFFVFPASDFEFLMCKTYAGHVNMLRERGDEILWCKKPPHLCNDKLGFLWERQVYNDKEFYSYVEGSHKFIWECRYYWEGTPKFRKVDIEEIYPQAKYFKK